jgi:CubicO group peptidase (beta-lactamase class C family)
MVASNTKGMVTLLLASLVDEGKLDWDAPVQRYLPDFRLGDAETSRKVLVRHLVCACTGLPRDDMQWILGTSDATRPQSTFDLLARTQPTSKFGEVYQYSNPLASAAGYLAGHVLYPDMELGAAFDRAMQERVFDPIGMTRATFGPAETLDGNWARPNSLALDGSIGTVDPRLNDVIKPYRPAGGLWASTHDVAEYVIEELGAGTVPGKPPVVSSRNALIRRDYGVQTGESVWYGMGLETDASSGVEVLQHGGSLLGYKTDWYAVPEAGAGIVLLLNSDAVSHALGEIVKRKFLEVIYDGKPEAAKYLADRVKRLGEDAAQRRKELAFPVPAAEAQALEGSYLNPTIGRLTLTRRDGQLVLRTASHWSQVAERTEADGSRSLVPVSPGALSFPFLVTERQGKRALVLNDNQHEFVFARDE